MLCYAMLGLHAGQRLCGCGWMAAWVGSNSGVYACIAWYVENGRFPGQAGGVS